MANIQSFETRKWEPFSGCSRQARDAAACRMLEQQNISPWHFSSVTKVEHRKENGGVCFPSAEELITGLENFLGELRFYRKKVIPKNPTSLSAIMYASWVQNNPPESMNAEEKNLAVRNILHFVREELMKGPNVRYTVPEQYGNQPSKLVIHMQDQRYMLHLGGGGINNGDETLAARLKKALGFVSCTSSMQLEDCSRHVASIDLKTALAGTGLELDKAQLKMDGEGGTLRWKRPPSNDASAFEVSLFFTCPDHTKRPLLLSDGRLFIFGNKASGVKALELRVEPLRGIKNEDIAWRGVVSVLPEAERQAIKLLAFLTEQIRTNIRVSVEARTLPTAGPDLRLVRFASPKEVSALQNRLPSVHFGSDRYAVYDVVPQSPVIAYSGPENLRLHFGETPLLWEAHRHGSNPCIGLDWDGEAVPAIPIALLKTHYTRVDSDIGYKFRDTPKVKEGLTGARLSTIIPSISSEIGITAGLRDRETVFVFRGKEISHEKALRRIREYLISRKLRLAGVPRRRFSRLAAIRESTTESGLMLQSVDEVMRALCLYAGHSIDASRAAEKELISQSSGLGGAFAGLAACSVESIRTEEAKHGRGLVPELLRDVRKALQAGEEIHRSYEYEAFGTAFFKTVLHAKPEGKGYVLKIGGQETEVQLAKKLRRPGVLLSAETELALSETSPGWATVDLKALLSGTRLEINEAYTNIRSCCGTLSWDAPFVKDGLPLDVTVIFSSGRNGETPLLYPDGRVFMQMGEQKNSSDCSSITIKVSFLKDKEGRVQGTAKAANRRRLLALRDEIAAQLKRNLNSNGDELL